MHHQAISLKHDETTDVVYDASDAGTGKTFVRIVSFAERRRKGRAGPMLVMAPRSLLKSAWFNDFRKFAPDMRVVVGNAANREDAFDQDVDVYVTNHDASKWLVQRKGVLSRFFKGDLVVDEMTAYKHHSSQRSKAMARISHTVDFGKRAGMSATPTALTILDMWHQMYILDKGERLGHSFYKFRDTVCKPVQVGRSVHAVRWEDKEGAEEAVFGILQDVVIRHKFDECVDIPKTHTYPVEYELPKKVRAAYEQMELAQMLLLKGGKKGAITALTAVNAAAVATKLLQICSGAVYGSDDKYHVIDDGRYDMVLDLIEARAHSLVFFQWKHQRDMLSEMATKRGITHCILDGSANDKAREAMVTQYQAGHFQTMFAHPRSAAHGLTLTKGTATIWPGPIYDLELWQQGNKRQARIGQKHKTEVIVCIAPGTIEEKVYEILVKKDARMGNLLSLFEEMARDIKLPK